VAGELPVTAFGGAGWAPAGEIVQAVRSASITALMPGVILIFLRYRLGEEGLLF
jgi:hypothetical protein